MRDELLKELEASLDAIANYLILTSDVLAMCRKMEEPVAALPKWAKILDQQIDELKKIADTLREG